MGIFQGAAWVSLVVVIAIVALVGFIFFRVSYRVPKADQALVITGGKKGLRVLPGRGSFVSPLRKHQFFPLGVMTVRSNDQETQTKTLVPVVVQWTAQLRADVETPGALEKAVQGFSGYTEEGHISQSLQQTLDGEVRAVVATMTPEQVVQDKDGFSTQVASGVQKRMEDLGFKLVSLNIAEVTDRNGHFHNIAAKDREERRREAETLTAQANQAVAVEKARSDEISQNAELERDLNVAEKTREVTLRKSAIQAETDQAQANAAIAGQLQTEIRNIELAAREGEVAVVREQQREAAAVARRAVELTDAETQKQRTEIEAAAKARKDEIEADAAAVVLERTAKGEADASVAKAQGEADAINRTTEARTNEIRQTGLAQAEVARAQGEAEAAATLAKGEAEAQVQRSMAEALAANDGANLRVTLAEIQRDTTVKVYSAMGEVMGSIGERATFIDMGGSSSGDGDLLSKVLGNVPELFKQLDVKSNALNGGSFGDTLGTLFASLTGNSPAEEPASNAASTTVVTTASPASVSIDDVAAPSHEVVEPASEPVDKSVQDDEVS